MKFDNTFIDVFPRLILVDIRKKRKPDMSKRKIEADDTTIMPTPQDNIKNSIG